MDCKLSHGIEMGLPCKNESVIFIDAETEWYSSGKYVLYIQWSDETECISGKGNKFKKSHQIYYDFIMCAMAQGDLY